MKKILKLPQQYFWSKLKIYMCFLCLVFLFRGIPCRSCTNIKMSGEQSCKNYNIKSESIGVNFSGNGEAVLEQVW